MKAARTSPGAAFKDSHLLVCLDAVWNTALSRWRSPPKREQLCKETLPSGFTVKDTSETVSLLKTKSFIWAKALLECKGMLRAPETRTRGRMFLSDQVPVCQSYTPFLRFPAYSIFV